MSIISVQFSSHFIFKISIVCWYTKVVQLQDWAYHFTWQFVCQVVALQYFGGFLMIVGSCGYVQCLWSKNEAQMWFWQFGFQFEDQLLFVRRLRWYDFIMCLTSRWSSSIFVGLYIWVIWVGSKNMANFSTFSDNLEYMNIMCCQWWLCFQLLRRWEAFHSANGEAFIYEPFLNKGKRIYTFSYIFFFGYL